MRVRVFRGRLPLLVKELTELAARPRTYVLRLIYGVTLFTIGCTVLFSGSDADVEAASRTLGHGRLLFNQLVHIQFVAIALMLPAMSCGLITVEKERDSLGLLLITALKPWEIILQKVLGRAIPMIGIVMLGLPLLSIAYSYGGVTEADLANAVVLLTLSCVQVAALGVMCSTWCRTTQSAFLSSYVMLLIGLSCFSQFFAHFWLTDWSTMRAEAPIGAVVPSGGRFAWGGLVAVSMSTVTFLVLSRVFLESRALVASGPNLMTRLFRWLDAVFLEWNRITGNRMISRDTGSLPGNRPIAWRETSKRLLGTLRYRFRILVAMMLPIILGIDLSVGGRGQLQFMLVVLWPLAAGLLIIHASSLIAIERTRQTLDVLLTTPLTGRDIMEQKLSAIRAMFWVLLVPFVTIYIFHTMIGRNVVYLLASLATVMVFLPLVAWVAFWLGLRMKSHVRAMIASILVVVGWNAWPQAADYLLSTVFATTIFDWVLMLSPLALIQAIETPILGSEGRSHISLDGMSPQLWTSFVVHAVLLLVVRQASLYKADRRLGRIPGA